MLPLSFMTSATIIKTVLHLTFMLSILSRFTKVTFNSEIAGSMDIFFSSRTASLTYQSLFFLDLLLCTNHFCVFFCLSNYFLLACYFSLSLSCHSFWVNTHVYSHNFSWSQWSRNLEQMFLVGFRNMISHYEQLS